MQEMKPKKSEVIEKICMIPQQMKEENTSFYDLGSKSGYLDFYEEITLEEIAEYISQNEDLLKSWVQLSEDKRSSEGYFLSVHRKPTVGRVIKNCKSKTPERFRTAEMACAAFLVYELKELFEIE